MNDVKKILITGESGFIGSHLIKHFVFKYPHYLIHGLDSLTYASNKNLTKDLIAQPNYFFHEIDIRNRHEVLDLFIHHQISDVIHLAAESHVDRSIANPNEFIFTKNAMEDLMTPSWTPNRVNKARGVPKGNKNTQGWARGLYQFS